MADEVIQGRYRLEQKIGDGGMSEVWLATDLELDRPVALKLLAPNADRQRFEREARAAAALSHPNINQLFDFGEVEGRPYMVLEFLPGGTLEDQLLDDRPLPDEQTGRIARDLAAGLADAHAHGLIHRDLKPSNVLFDSEGRAKIADFGIAHMGDGGTLTEAGTVLGTAAYISPEQAAGEPAGPASDVYSFGVILFRMLTGRLPFESDQPLELVAMHRDLAPPALEDIRPDVPPRLESLTAAALAKDPRDRPADGSALLAELGSAGGIEATQVLGAPPPPHREAGRRRATPKRRIPLPALIGGFLAAGAAGLGLAYLATRGASSTSTPTTTTRRQTTQPTKAAATQEHSQATTSTTTATTAHTTTRQQTPPPTSTPAPPPTTAPPTTATVPVTTGTTVDTTVPTLP
ncbi:MAG: eukaryotic-like serine/threonine-protein kinase [Gaiellaceae bacterium]|jgi:serine/threonine protein kinase|nr:eukaryotic-like serine/threonine-protein kinase [Gaiellaceae bacterium]MDX6508755.1 eukaryotic-like serine/threonine-protein kinase [Gaiellaceae bacterium]